MKNMKRWKRLLAVGMCSAMMFSMTVGVSATENQDTEETNVVETQEEEETAPEEEAVLKGDSGVSANKNDKLPQVDKEALEKAIENAVEPESTVEVTETEEDSDELPIVEWNNNFTVSHSKDQLVGYDIELGDEWKLITEDSGKEPSNVKKYINGALMDSQTAWKYVFVFSFEPENLAEPLEITYEIDKLEHYSNGKVDGIAKNVRISYKTEVEESEGKPYILPVSYYYDGTQDLVFKLKDGIGDYAIKNINEITFYDDDGGRYFFVVPNNESCIYDAEAGTVTVKSTLVNYRLNCYPFIENRDKLKMFDVSMSCTLKNGEEHSYGGTNTSLWKVYYVANDWNANEEKPELINTSYEFDGTEDMVFNFKNGTGDNAIVSVEQVLFNIKERNNADENGQYLVNFYIGNYGVSYNYDIEKGQVTLFKHAVSALVHSDRSDWEAVKNVYGNCCITVKLANGEIRTLYGGEGADWTVKVLERSPEASSQHVVNLTESLNEFDADQMQNLIDINKNADVVLRTPEGVTFTFAKGTMRMIDDKDGYPFGVEIIADFSKSGIKNTNVESSVFACRINFEYSGELPGTAKISIPVDNKWNGQTLYYYQVMEDGTLKDTGKSGKVENGIFDVLQSHCSDYVLLAKSPKELGVTENTDNDNNNNNTGNGNNQTGNGNNQTGNGNTQGSGNNSTTQVKPADTTKTSPKTGDNNMILLFAVLCAGSCVVGVSTLKARRKIR